MGASALVRKFGPRYQATNIAMIRLLHSRLDPPYQFQHNASTRQEPPIAEGSVCALIQCAFAFLLDSLEGFA